MADKNWWERNVEDATAEQLDKERGQIAPDDDFGRAKHDVVVGASKGAYRAGKSLVGGAIDVAIVAGKVLDRDPETLDSIWSGAKKAAKESWTALFGSAEEKADQNRRASDAISGVANAVANKVRKDWSQAEKDGKKTELISSWVTQGIIEIAAFFVGAGEVKAAAQAYKAQRLARAGEAASVVAKCPIEEAAQAKKLLEAEKAAKALAAETKAAEAAKAAKAARQRAIDGTGPAAEPWLVRPGEGKFPKTAKTAGPDNPMVLDPDAPNGYMYIVKEDGTIVYAPQKMVDGRETVKHTDLAENGPARIGGEIHYNKETGAWEMDAESGRYSATKLPSGIVVGNKTPENLEAAAELARQSGAPAIVAKP